MSKWVTGRLLPTAGRLCLALVPYTEQPAKARGVGDFPYLFTFPLGLSPFAPKPYVHGTNMGEFVSLPGGAW